VPRAVLRAARLHRAQPFGAFWVMMSYMLFPVVLLRLMGTRVPYLLTLQEGDPWEHMFTRWFILPFRPLLSTGFKNASAIQAISTYLAQWAERMGYLGHAGVVPNGVNVGHFTGTPAKHEGTVLITASRLVRKNAVDTVIEALALLPPSVRFRILGMGPEEDALKKLIRVRGVQDRVEFLGHIDHKEMPRYLHAADMFVRPSRSEGMGNVFIEAMAAGLPVIATQEGGIADFLFDAKRNPDKETTGWAVDRDSPEQIAEAVKNILAHPEQAARVTATAKKLVSENYDWNLIAERMRALLALVCRR
jgi:glycosyltransferase involved in cell wall biosynthesis